MKINQSNSKLINQAYTNQALTNPAQQQETEAKSVGKSVDSVNLSATTKILTAMKVEPEERAQKVSAIKESVESGQYTVNAEQVAEKIIGHFLNKIA